MTDVEREPVLGIGHQIGPIAERYGPDWAPLKCDVCQATWIGPIGEWCEYCTTWNRNALDNHTIPKPKPSSPTDIFEQALHARTNGNKGGMVGDTELHNMLLNWERFWAKDHTEAEWIAEPIIPAGRSVALFAPGGTGKSLLALWLAVCIATGQPIFDHTNPPRPVLYLDYEMTEDDLAERLETMGFADADLTNLHYALLPSLPGLDQREGGEAVLRLAELCAAELVIVDTFGRAVHGDENDADTVRAWYRWTGIHLKHAGRAFVRVDHAGKDLTRGQRGTSAKNDDVDVVWQMTVRDNNSYHLAAKKRRMGWIPEEINLRLDDEDTLTFTLLDQPGYLIGTTTTATLLDELGASLDITTRQAGELLRDNGQPTRRRVIVAAVKYRRQAVENLLGTGLKVVPANSGTTPPTKASGTGTGTGDGPNPKPQLDDPGTTTGTTGNHNLGATYGGGFPRSGEPPDGTPPQPDPLWEDF